MMPLNPSHPTHLGKVAGGSRCFHGPDCAGNDTGSFGGTLRRGFANLALSYQTLYVPTRRPDPFVRALTLDCDRIGDDLLVSARLREW